MPIIVIIAMIITEIILVMYQVLVNKLRNLQCLGILSVRVEVCLCEGNYIRGR